MHIGALDGSALLAGLPSPEETLGLHYYVEHLVRLAKAMAALSIAG
jgi:hypothetical protein